MTNLQRIRKDRGLLQRDLANALGITRAAYSNYETGLRKPKPDMLAKIADILTVSVDELLGHMPKNRHDTYLQWDEQIMLKKYRALSQRGQARTMKLMDFELGIEAQDKAMESTIANTVANTVM